jgi:hypothetical protein
MKLPVIQIAGDETPTTAQRLENKNSNATVTQISLDNGDKAGFRPLLHKLSLVSPVFCFFPCIQCRVFLLRLFI